MGFPVPGMDQTAYVAEIWGITQARLALKGLEGEACILVDNRAVVDELEGWLMGTRNGFGNMPAIREKNCCATRKKGHFHLSLDSFPWKEKRGLESPGGMERKGLY